MTKLNIFYSISTIGIRSEMTDYERKSLILLNRITFFVIFFFGIISLMGYFRLESPVIGHLFLGNTIMLLFALLLNKRGNIDFSKYLISMSIPVTLVFGGAYAKSMGVTDNLIFYLSPRILLIVAMIIPVLTFGYREVKKTVIALLPGVIVFLMYDIIHGWFGIYLIDLQLDVQVYPMYVVVIILFMAFVVQAILNLQSVNYKSERKLHEHNSFLLASEEELKQQNEEILSINDHLKEKQKIINKHQVEIELQNEHYSDLVNLMPGILFEADLDGNLSFVNHKFHEILGYGKEDIQKGLNFWNLLDISEKEVLQQTELKLKEVKELENIRFSVTQKSGSLLPVLASIAVLEERGTVFGYRVILLNMLEFESLRVHLLKLSKAVEQSATTVVITNINAEIEYVNPKFTSLTGYTLDEVIGKNPNILNSGEHIARFYEGLWQTITSGKVWKGRFHNKKKNGEFYWEQAIITPILDNKGEVINFIAVKEDITSRVETDRKLKNLLAQLSEQNALIQGKNNKILDSINYAKIIQQAVFPSIEQIKKSFPTCFIINQPKDIVSGDFYFHAKIDQYDILVASDCTGHGVPGGFMTMLGLTFLDEVVRSENVSSPADALDMLRSRVIDALGQNNANYRARDGMDMALCAIDRERNVLNYAGANRPIYFIRDGELKVIKPDKMPIGMYHKMKPFTNHSISLKAKDRIYMFTDGVTDQFGGEKNKKFSSPRLRELILSIQNKSFDAQKEIIENNMSVWQGDFKQVDDILFMAIEY